MQKVVENFQDAVDKVLRLSNTDYAKIFLSSFAKKVCDSLRVNLKEKFTFSEDL